MAAPLYTAVEIILAQAEEGPKEWKCAFPAEDRSLTLAEMDKRGILSPTGRVVHKYDGIRLRAKVPVKRGVPRLPPGTLPSFVAETLRSCVSPRSYKGVAKATCVHKDEFNERLAEYVRVFCRGGYQTYRAVVLDSQGARSSQALIQEGLSTICVPNFNADDVASIATTFHNWMQENPRLQLTVQPIALRDALRGAQQHRKPVAVVVADYCCQFNKGVQDDLSMLFESGVTTRRCFVSVTLNTRGQHGVRVVSQLAQHMKKLGEACGRKVELQFQDGYQNMVYAFFMLSSRR